MRRAIFYLFFFTILSAITAQVKEINYDWNTIKAADGKLNIKEVKQWGGVNARKDEIFKYPSDIEVDSKGNCFISDFGTHEVFKYDKNGKFTGKFGRAGAGPGDLKHPASIALDSKENLVVFEEGNYRVQVFENGKSKRIMMLNRIASSRMELSKRDEVIFPAYEIDENAPLLEYYNWDKKVVKKIGSFHTEATGVNRRFEKPSLFTCDNNDCSYIGYSKGKLMIEKYSADGKIMARLNIKLSMQPEGIEKIKTDGNSMSVMHKEGSSIAAIDVDDEGNLYLLVMKKPAPSQSTPGFMSMSSGGSMEVNVMPPKQRVSKFDVLALIVFDKNWKLKGMQSFDYFAEGLKVIKDNVFIKDPYLDSVIRQYKIVQ